MLLYSARARNLSYVVHQVSGRIVYAPIFGLRAVSQCYILYSRL